MRAHSLIQVLSAAVIVTVVAIAMKSRATAVDLQARLATLTTARSDVSHKWVQERDRLRFALEEATLRRQEDATPTLPVLTQPEPPLAVASLWKLGEWCSARDWRNEGQSTARNTVGTLLWAAAGGDLASMTSLLAFDETSRTQAQIFFDALSPAARAAFPSPEALVASLTIQAIPTSAAQLSWFHQRDDDHATVGLLLGDPNQPAPTEILAVAPKDNRPIMLVDHRDTRLTVLSLQRSSTGWRVVVPAAAVERLARQYKLRADPAHLK